MKKLFRLTPPVLLVVFLALLVALIFQTRVALASGFSEASAPQGVDTLAFLSSLLSLVPAVALAPPLIAFALDVSKRFGWLKDGYAPLISGAINLALYAALYFAGPDNAAKVANVVTAIVSVGTVILSVLTSSLVTNLWHNGLNWAGMGFSHSKSKQAALPVMMKGVG